ncbi:NADH dehydrogenase subunit J [Geoalkalibacter ferrihydriticus]|uniref:NADH-quinone oxidoreductase subunit J n=2 Tax=Geoalkalibacter ferrihydriticus TaxID=392333 RepID=A0A0C2EG63_9BACT|nr:NADH-quinone oxidoreductase subunit J [Geoalkalibacter ferrihydriticus]KIH77608.1 NADH dehydrogenase [Geoalkalibacter ferrihydriticus DSM 17813]SDL70045.1 NADH dehydrogenase subunit J [Geoalkalibacter ferrihydriticus]
MELLFFYLVAMVAVLSGFSVVMCKNPVNSGISLVMTFFCLAIFYVMLYAPFMAAVQVLVYAGAIMVLILFVIMLLNLGPEMMKKFRHGVIGGAIVSAIVMLQVMMFVNRGTVAGVQGDITKQRVLEEGHMQIMGLKLFTEFMLPFQITGILLLIAIVGALVLAKKDV